MELIEIKGYAKFTLFFLVIIKNERESQQKQLYKL